MHKFKCKNEDCAGFCELIIDVCDLEDVLPEYCPCDKNIEVKWEKVENKKSGE